MTLVAIDRQQTRPIEAGRLARSDATEFAAGKFDLVGSGIVDLRPYLYRRAVVWSAEILAAATLIAVALFALDLRSAFTIAAEAVVFFAAVFALYAARYLLSRPDGGPRGQRFD